MAGMVVQHNLNALNSYNRLNANVAGLKKASEKLSSGYRINRAGDDAAGLAISEKMRSQIRGLNQAKRNAQDGISMIQTYEGALQESHSILQRMKELAAESANGTYQDDVDRDAIQLEFDQLNDELNAIADTDFNGVVALNGGVMSDGSVANNTTVVSDKITLEGVDGDANASIVYSENIRGVLDSAGNGNINVNGLKVEVKAGAISDGGSPDGDGSTVAFDAAIVKDGKFVDGKKITVTELYKIGADDTEITINGSKYTIDQATKKLYDEDGAEVTKDTHGFAVTVTPGDNIKTVTEYTLTASADGKSATVENAVTGEVGKLEMGEGVSKPNAYDAAAANLTYADSITLQVGARSKDAVDFNFSYNSNGIGELEADLDVSARGLATDQLSLATQDDANYAIDKIDNAINKVSMVRATFGSIQNRLEHKIENITVTTENMTEAESTIRDTDMASEMMNYTKFNILQQAAQSMLAQANQQPQSILQLLG